MELKSPACPLTCSLGPSSLHRTGWELYWGREVFMVAGGWGVSLSPLPGPADLIRLPEAGVYA